MSELPPVTAEHIAQAKRQIERGLFGLQGREDPFPPLLEQIADAYRAEQEALRNPLAVIPLFETIREIVKDARAQDADGFTLARRVREAVPTAMDLIGAISMLESHGEWYSIYDKLTALRIQDQLDAEQATQ